MHVPHCCQRNDSAAISFVVVSGTFSFDLASCTFHSYRAGHPWTTVVHFFMGACSALLWLIMWLKHFVSAFSKICFTASFWKLPVRVGVFVIVGVVMIVILLFSVHLKISSLLSLFVCPSTLLRFYLPHCLCLIISPGLFGLYMEIS